MKVRWAIGTIGLLVISGCTGFGVSFTGDDSDDQCRRGPSGAPKLIVINIKYDDKKIDRPGRACARPGDTLWFKIKAKHSRQVSVAGKEEPDNWIRGGSKHAWFFVPVPYDAIEENDDDGEVFSYSIMVEDGPDLDPEVLVRHSF
jgi:hypothetical protein